MTEPNPPRIVAATARLDTPAKLTARQKRAAAAWRRKAAQQPTGEEQPLIRICGACLRQPCAKDAVRCDACEQAWRNHHREEPTP